MPTARHWKNISNVHFMKRADYRGTIETVVNITGVDSLCVLFYEHLFDELHGKDELRRLCDLLGIGYRPAKIDARINASDQIAFSEEVRRILRGHFAPVYDCVRQRYGSRVPAAWEVRTASNSRSFGATRGRA